MKPNDLETKLIRAARQESPQDHVPYAFEKRIMARLAALQPPNPWALWGRPLWRAAISCVALTVICGIWSAASTPQAETADSLSQSFDHAVFASSDQHLEDIW